MAVRIRVQSMHASHRTEDPKHPVEIEICVGYNLMGRTARFYIPALSDGTVEGSDFVKALRNLADAFEQDFGRMGEVAQAAPKLILPPNVAKEAANG